MKQAAKEEECTQKKGETSLATGKDRSHDRRKYSSGKKGHMAEESTPLERKLS